MVNEELTGRTEEQIRVHAVASLVEAHHLANVVGEQVKGLGLDSTHVAHGLMVEGIQQLLGVDLHRADELARGFITLAVADQAQHLKDGQADIIARAIDGAIRDAGFKMEVGRLYRANMNLLQGSTVIPQLP